MTITIHGYDEAGEAVDLELYYDHEELSPAMRVPEGFTGGAVFFSDTDFRHGAEALQAVSA